jgi:hypothetical protein
MKGEMSTETDEQIELINHFLSKRAQMTSFDDRPQLWAFEFPQCSQGGHWCQKTPKFEVKGTAEE